MGYVMADGSNDGSTVRSQFVNAYGQPMSPATIARRNVAWGGVGDPASEMSTVMQPPFTAERINMPRPSGIIPAEVAAFLSLAGQVNVISWSETCKNRLKSIAATVATTMSIPPPGTPDGDFIVAVQAGVMPAECKVQSAAGSESSFPWWIVAVAGGALIIYLLAK